MEQPPEVASVHVPLPDDSEESLPVSDGSAGRPKKPRLPELPFWLELPVLVLLAFGVAFLVKTFLFQAFYIPSGSMENTLQIGDRVFVNKVVYDFHDPRRGDIVVFNGVDSFSPEVIVPPVTNPFAKLLQGFGRLVGFAPPDERDFVKRVVGVGGDHVRCCDVQGRVTVNGVPLDETAYIFPGNKPSDSTFSIIVPAGKLFVMGDHRAASADSRAHLGDPGGGFVPVDRVIGQAFVIVWPYSDATFIHRPATFQGVGAPTSSK
jgi:signal peptidase I